MKKLKSILTLSIMAIFLISGVALADWAPADGHKMHWPQLPNPDGWDVMASEPFIAADDWQCSETGWITDIHFWGSWNNDMEGPLIGFLISFHEDIPDPTGGGYSMPGTVLLNTFIPIDRFLVAGPFTGPQGWYDPAGGIVYPENHMMYFQYNLDLEYDLGEWIWQEVGTIYWLNISAVVDLPMLYQWGWKTTTPDLRFNDTSVWAEWAFYPEFWEPIYDPFIQGEHLDLAFVVTNDNWEPTVFPAVDTECPVIQTECPEVPVETVCPVTETKCPTVDTECPVILTECPEIYTECPMLETVCTTDQTHCPVDQTICPIIETECPADPLLTICPEIATECPVVETECPTMPTYCPDGYTYCPEEPTWCPIWPTECPMEPTFCPQGQTLCEFTICDIIPTWCPDDPTFCPVDFTLCPDLPTICYDIFTECPEIPTECPTIPTVCDVIVPTECPIDPTYCPTGIPTMCPEISTVCPEIPTSCPAITTECPAVATVCEVTTCPEVETSCPSGTTWCPYAETSCPTGQTWCPVDPTSCPMYDEDYDGDYDDCDNCPKTPNGPSGGTCTGGNIGDPCTVPGSNIPECGILGYCSMNQEDSYPLPSGNECGDACECEGNFDNDVDVDGIDTTTFLVDLGRFTYNNPCIASDPCNGDFDCDGDVDGADTTKFLEDLGRFTYNKPCPQNCQTGPWCTY